jgi:hypothetical protein
MLASCAVLSRGGPLWLRVALVAGWLGAGAVALLVAWPGVGRGPATTSRRRVGSVQRRRRRRSFVLTMILSALVIAVSLRLVGWWALCVVPAVAFGVTGALLGGSEISLRPSRPRRWIVPALVVALLAPIAWSISSSATAPGPEPLPIRGVEWLRDHGGAGLVNSVEAWWYTNHPPPVGGVPTQLPVGPRVAAAPTAEVLGASATPSTVPGPPPPAPVVSPVQPPLEGEGQWVVVAGAASRPAVAATLVRPDNVHTSVMVGVLRIDPAQVRMSLVPGTELPGGPAPSEGAVPEADRAKLVAVFNAGFRMQESGGGWFADGREAVPLRDGAASLVLRDDGRADVGVWGRDVTMDPHVTAVRQNLELLVDGGAVVPGTEDNSSLRWGATLGNAVLVDRSAVGVTADGALIYVGGPGMSVTSLAQTLVAAGAVRGMELDINKQWVDAYTYVPGPDGPVGRKLVDAMRYPPEHYLSPQSRDFISVVLGPGVPVAAY